MKTPRILVVGGGPVGLTLACELYRHGVTCRLVEKDTQRHEQSRATDIQSGTLRVLEDMGVLEAFHDAGAERDELAMFADGGLVAHMSVTELDTPYPYALGLGQNESERLLEEHLIGLGGRLERGVEVTGVTAVPGAVEVAMTTAAGPSVESYDWVIGCDGSHSAVRTSVGLKLEGATMAERFFLADVDYVSDRSHREISFWTGAHGALIVLPIPGTVRVFGDLATDVDEIDLEFVQREIRDRTRGNADATALGWAATFNVHARIVSNYRRGRVFLAGDAAHIHSPAGGHGMNTGVQDAYNLGWKLALVARGEAHETLLDSYDAERRPVGRAVVTETDWETRAATWRSATGQRAVGKLISLALKLTPLRQRMMIHALELDVGYPGSPIVGESRPSLLSARLLGSDAIEEPCVGQWREFGAGPAPGQAAPDVQWTHGRLYDRLAGTRHTLLLFDGRADTAEGYARLNETSAVVEAEFGAHVTTHIIVPHAEAPAALGSASVLLDPDGDAHQRFGASAECAYLIRPDGYIGFRNQPANGADILGHLRRLFGVSV